MTSDGVNSYTWDRANRLLTWDNGVAADLVNHTYDGEGRRVSQAVGTTSPTITKYLLDIQPGLAVVLSQTEGSDVTRFVHAPRGIHARQDAMNDWYWTVQDGLGTVRVETDNSVAVEGSQNLDPFGNLIDLNGMIGTPYGFTGELVDGSGLLDLRARRYNAGIGVFASLDPFEGMQNRAMSLNGYSWVEGNVPNIVDPRGMWGQLPSHWASCVSSNNVFASSTNSTNCDPAKRSADECACEEEFLQFLESGPGMLFFGLYADWMRLCLFRKAAQQKGGCRIEVAGKSLNLQPPGPLNLGHATVIYTDEEGVVTVYRGGGYENRPECTPGGPGDYGYICVQADPLIGPEGEKSIDQYIANPNQPRDVLLAGCDACGKKACLDDQVNLINMALIPYDPLGPNSNSVARSLLQNCGIPVVPPREINLPGWQDHLYD